jgi:hypothetical protein
MGSTATAAGEAVAQPELLADFFDRALPTKDWLQYIKDQRINLDSLFHRAGLLGITRVRWHAERRFEFDDAGMAAAVLTVLDHNGIVADLVAWPGDRPDKFAPALGHVAVLGADQIDDGESHDGGLRVWRTPLTWLQHRCRGVVILDQHVVPLCLAGALGPLVGEDVQHARELTRLLRRHVDAPDRVPAMPMLEVA